MITKYQIVAGLVILQIENKSAPLCGRKICPKIARKIFKNFRIFNKNGQVYAKI